MVASLFLATAAVSITAAFFLDPMLNTPNYLAEIVPNKATLVLSAVLLSINNIGIVFIAVYMYPLLKKLNETAAVGYLAIRIIEGTVMMVGIAATLMLIPLSDSFIAAGAPPSSWYQTLGDVLKHGRFVGLSLLSSPLLGLGGCIFTWQLIRARLVPRFIAVVGFIGYVMIFFPGVAAWFGAIDLAPGSSGMFVAIPVALFEIILLPFWLFFRGFKMPDATV